MRAVKLLFLLLQITAATFALGFKANSAAISGRVFLGGLIEDSLTLSVNCVLLSVLA